MFNYGNADVSTLLVEPSLISCIRRDKAKVSVSEMYCCTSMDRKTPSDGGVVLTHRSRGRSECVCYVLYSRPLLAKVKICSCFIGILTWLL